MLIAAGIAVVAALFGAAPQAPIVVDSYQVRVTERNGGVERRFVSAPERAAVRGRGAAVVRRGGLEVIGGRGGFVLRNAFAARPEGFSSATDRHTELVDAAIAEARGRSRTLTPVRLGGRAALRTDIALPPNDCAGLPARTARLWLSERTLLPLRVVVRREADGRLLDATLYSYSRVNRKMPASLFSTPRVGPQATRTNQRFLRRSPARAAGSLPYRPRLPRVVPPGFTLAISGFAPRSGATGAEASIPPSRHLFSATYRRGQERVEVSQRVASSPWPDDPFGAECRRVTHETVQVGSATATFGTGPEVVPHLYWNEGAIRHTVSGPFPKDDLVAIASSLAP